MSIDELEAYFSGIELPQTIELDKGVMIMDLPLFLNSHFKYLKKSGELKSAEVFVVRLHQLHAKLESIRTKKDCRLPNPAI